VYFNRRLCEAVKVQNQHSHICKHCCHDNKLGNALEEIFLVATGALKFLG
jgi:hypothetical protein